MGRAVRLQEYADAVRKLNGIVFEELRAVKFENVSALHNVGILAPLAVKKV